MGRDEVSDAGDDSDDSFDELLKEAADVPARSVRAPGTVVAGRYRLDGLLGEGGMGIVWAATHEVTRRRFALKFMHGPHGVRPAMRRRFLREARVASAVDHPNVVPIRDVLSLNDGELVMVMDLLEGETLRSKIERDAPLTPEEAATLLLPVVSAVGTAHAQGVVHRDLKPDNIFLVGEDAEPRVLDFGLAKLVSGHDDSTASTLTRTGEPIGTPAYMAPEQALGEPDVDQRADIWSLGTILYECLTGERLIRSDRFAQIIRELGDDAPPISESRPDLPAEMARLLDGMLTRDRYERLDDLQSAHELLSKLATTQAPDFDKPNLIEPKPDEATKRSDAATTAPTELPSRTRWLGIAVGAGVVAAAGYWALGGSGEEPPKASPASPPSPHVEVRVEEAPPASDAPPTKTATTPSVASPAPSAPTPRVEAAPFRQPQPISSARPLAPPAPSAKPADESGLIQRVPF